LNLNDGKQRNEMAMFRHTIQSGIRIRAYPGSTRKTVRTALPPPRTLYNREKRGNVLN